MARNGETTNDEYEVEKILRKRISNGKVEYFVKWKDYDESENSWIKKKDAGCLALIAAFERTQPKNHDSKESSPFLDDDGDDPNQHAVKRILDKREKRGRVEYKIWWDGYSAAESTWEEEKNVHCTKLIKEFEKERERKRKSENGPSTSNVRTEASPEKRRNGDSNSLTIKTIVGTTKGRGGAKLFTVKMGDDSIRHIEAEEMYERFPREALEYFDKIVFVR